ncbi:MAG: pilus assembly protein [Rhodobacteraceae bacterium]|nr:pilus assembly protein [Paracoccaceae bacterium]
MSFLSNIRHRLVTAPLKTLRFWREERGTATIEFVLTVPIFLVLVTSAVELGVALTRHVMLDRGLDVAVRQVRLGQIDTADTATYYTELKQAICDNAFIIPDCINQLKLEMIRVDPLNWTGVPAVPDCIDRDDPAAAARGFVRGQRNQLMVLRACALFDPLYPTTGIGASIPRASGDAFALVSTASFVIEPI